jgi:hypothetical protein
MKHRPVKLGDACRRDGFAAGTRTIRSMIAKAKDLMGAAPSSKLTDRSAARA